MIIWIVQKHGFSIKLSMLIFWALLALTVTAQQSLIEIISENASLKKLAELVAANPLLKGLLDSDNITIFAPDNTSLEKRAEELSELNEKEIFDLMRLHILPVVLLPDEEGFSHPNTLYGNPISLFVSKGPLVSIEQVSQLVSSVECIRGTNGIICIIDNILAKPHSLSEALKILKYEKFLSSLQRFDIMKNLEDRKVTIFAPSDSRYPVREPDNLEKVLKLHIAETVFSSTDFNKISVEELSLDTIHGNILRVNQFNGLKIGFDGKNYSKVITSGKYFDNGIIYGIDGFIPFSSENILESNASKKFRLILVLLPFISTIFFQ
jgi:uncharacterized surface protein with fasciclin (FAS1) repeats